MAEEREGGHMIRSWITLNASKYYTNNLPYLECPITRPLL